MPPGPLRAGGFGEGDASVDGGGVDPGPPSVVGSVVPGGSSGLDPVGDGSGEGGVFDPPDVPSPVVTRGAVVGVPVTCPVARGGASPEHPPRAR